MQTPRNNGEQHLILVALGQDLPLTPERAAEVSPDIVRQLRAQPLAGLVRLLLNLGEKLPPDGELEEWAERVAARIKAMGSETVARAVEELKGQD
jgi:hypothetical protein